jgi:5'-nucleotidase
MEKEKQENPANILIPNQERLDSLIKNFKEQGKDKIHVLADFDRTLTKCFVGDEKITSLISILRKENLLNDDYSKTVQVLFDQYHPIEINPNIPFNEKKSQMAKWWRLHNNELIKHKLNKKNIEQVINSGKVQFRAGTLEFLDLLKQQNIPLIIMSSSGLGTYTISRFLEKKGKLYDNIHIISNTFEFDSAGNVIKFNEPVIHSLNKDETVVKDFPEIFEQIKDKKNVILLGDNLEDIGMIEGFDYDNLIKIGFLNENIEENLSEFQKNFDIIILNDGEMDFVNNLIREII